MKRLKRNLARTENELALAKASSGGDLVRPAGRLAPGLGLTHFQAKELESRRQALFAMSRGNASPGVLCLRSYVIMTCPAVSACLVDGDDAAVHGDIKLNDVACAGYLKKKGGKRHNWNNRWFIFDLRHRKVGYFEDQSLKKECGLFGMETVMHALKAPASGADGARGEADARKLLVVTPKRTYQLEAPTAESADLWLAVFNTSPPARPRVRAHSQSLPAASSAKSPR